MSATWGVYNLQGKLADGTVVDGDDRRAVRWLIRWRVNGELRKRTFKTKGHAKTFRARLLAAQGMGWPADARGWPVEPSTGVTEVGVDEGPRMTFEDYCLQVWYPTAKTQWKDKNRLGHRRNMRLAIEFLRYADGDHRAQRVAQALPGSSILLDDLVRDDVLLALAQRRQHNGRTAAKNARRTSQAVDAGAESIELLVESVSPATLRAFYITLSMIIRSAHASELISRDPLVDTARYAPKPTQARITQRVVPSIDEIFDLSDAIASLGPVAPDGRPAGERFRSLVLAGGTLGPRPGELVAHRSGWIDWDEGGTVVRFHRTEARIYDSEEGVSGLQENPLKHRHEDDWRDVPALSEVADALRLHLERGYGTEARTWTSVTGRALDWHNLLEVYWRPACAKVFGGTQKDILRHATPGILRKAAITFWLDSGIHPFLASDWAGHSEDVSRRYYAGRATTSFSKELELLANATASR